MATKRTIDLLTESYKDQMTARRKYEFKNSKGEKVVDLYFKPLTRLRRDSWLNFEFFLATELGKTINELRTSISEEELIYWAAYYENKYEEEKRELRRQKYNSG
jgi:hypothetical protein